MRIMRTGTQCGLLKTPKGIVYCMAWSSEGLDSAVGKGTFMAQNFQHAGGSESLDRAAL